MSNNNMRATTDVTIAFTLPKGYGADVAKHDFVAVQLPFQWMGVHGWMDGSVTPSASMKSVTTKGTTVTKKAMAGAVSQVSGCNMVFALDLTKDATNHMAEEGSYEFVISGMPTTESKAGADAMMLGSMVLSVGLTTKGGFGWSSAPLFNALKVGTLPEGINLLEFSTKTVKISRGTYTPNAVCIQPAVGNFKGPVTAKVDTAAFLT